MRIEEKIATIALGAMVGFSASYIASEYGPKAFESATADRLTGLGYHITPDKEDGTLILETERVPRWADAFLSIPFSLAKNRVFEACGVDTYLGNIVIRGTNLNDNTSAISQRVKLLADRNQCFPNTTSI